MISPVRFTDIYSQLSRAHTYHTNNGVGWFSLPRLDELGVVAHGFSARFGGVSAPPFDSLNLSFKRPQEHDHVMENYRRFCMAADIPVESMVMDSYEHGTVVRPVAQADCGRGYTREPLPNCDGLVSADGDVTLMTGHADCMAFFAADPAARCIGLSHAGWRGALGRIGRGMVEQMRARYGARPENIYVGVGPSICPHCFEVGEDVAELFNKAYPHLPLRLDGLGDKPRIDLWMAAAYQFIEAGVLPEHIQLMDVCTVEDERLFSYRRAKGPTGGMAAFLRLNKACDNRNGEE